MLQDYQDLIDGLLGTPTKLRAALGEPVPADISEEIRSALSEMQARESAMLRRALAVLREKNPHLRDLEREVTLSSLEEQEGQTNPETLLERFILDRGELISALMNLTLSDWERPVLHETAGETSLSDEIDDHLTWDEGMVAKLTS